MSSPASAASDMVRVFVFFMNLDNPVQLVCNAVQNVTTNVGEKAVQSIFSQCFETLELENKATAGPSAVYFNNEIYMFYQNGGTGELCYNVFNGSTWGAKTQIPGVGLTGSPSAVVFNNQLYVFYQGPTTSNGALYYLVSSDGVNWSEQDTVPTGLSDSPSAVVFNDKLYVFYRGGGNAESLWYSVFDGSSWGTSGTQVPNCGLSCSPSATVLGSELYVFYKGEGDSLYLYYSTSSDGSSWSGSNGLNVGLPDSPTAVTANGNIYVFHMGSDNNLNELWHIVYSDGSWSQDTQVAPMQMTASPSAVYFKDQLYYFYQGAGNSGVLWCTVWNGTSVTNMYQFANGAAIMSCTPGPVVFNDELYVFYQGPNENGGLYYMTSSDGVNWTAASQVFDANLTDSPSPVVFNGKLYVFYQGLWGATHWTLYSVWDGTSWSATISVPDYGLWYSPSAVVFNDLLYVFVRGQGSGSQVLWCKTSTDGTNWSASTQPQLGNGESGSFFPDQSPAAVVFNGKLYIFSSGNAQLDYFSSSDGSSWGQLYAVGGTYGSSEGAFISGWPAAVSDSGTLYCLYQSSEGGRLGVATSTDGSNWNLPQPATNSAQYPFATMFTLTQAEYNALSAVTDG